jgi:hypothetical protein
MAAAAAAAAQVMNFASGGSVEKAAKREDRQVTPRRGHVTATSRPRRGHVIVTVWCGGIRFCMLTRDA